MVSDLFTIILKIELSFAQTGNAIVRNHATTLFKYSRK